MKIVLDTNVVISAALGSKSCSRTIIKASREKIIEPLLVKEELEKFLIKVQLKKEPDGDNLTRGYGKIYKAYIKLLFVNLGVIRS
ncbi:MAG: PIN domain-containing protein [Kosmotoga sp.]|nr:MAG: PIN domain-containing protein [Kosmotoga sp.]